MKSISIQCPAKINMTLKVVGKRDDGFHNIESIMQTIDLYDYLYISMIQSDRTKISLRGNSDTIPYDKTNLVYKAAKLYLDANGLKNFEFDINIEKHIPVSAGLAGGSTDAAGTLYALNKFFDNRMSQDELLNLCAQLGSDLNFCLIGGRALTKGRGEIIEPKEHREININLIKPLDIGISAREAYTSFAEKTELEGDNRFNRRDYVNDLEWAIIDKYPTLQQIKKQYKTAVMTGSGSTYFSTKEEFIPAEDFWVENGHKTIPYGVRMI